MSQDQILCVSYFDQVIGPSQLYCSESLTDVVGAPNLDKILEFNAEEGTFIFAYRKYQTLNHLFYIDSKFARGGKELLMITFMIKTAFFKDEIVDVFKYLDSKTPVLVEFAGDIKKLNELTSLFHLKKSPISEKNILNFADEELKASFLEIYNRYFKKLTPKFRLETPIKSKKQVKKIFIVGSPKTGKKTLLKNIELIQFLNIKNNDLPTRIYEVIIENLEILNFDQVKCEFGCKAFDSFEACLQHSQGLILIFKLSNENSILETKNMFQVIEEKFIEIKIDSVPVLIIGNKFSYDDDTKKEFIHNTFEIENLKKNGRRIRYFPIKILEEDQKVMKALRWMIKNIL
ncbi:MAG: ADP-ribosylation factor-like protein [Promethearchaeota archaeon]|jgi:signal recognition particle receptor subunit beta